MENPLSQEQIKKLNEIAGLPPEEQKAQLQEFLQTLSPEQIEYLKKQQSANGGCPFCLINEGKIKSRIVYNDEKFLGVLDIRPANKGHVVLFPKKHYSVLAVMPEGEVSHMFKVANKLSQAIYEKIKCQGTNIVVSNGEAAGQRVDHVVVHILPRFDNDKVVINWGAINVDEKEMQDAEDKLKGQVNVEEEKPAEEKDDMPPYEEEERIP